MFLRRRWFQYWRQSCAQQQQRRGEVVEPWAAMVVKKSGERRRRVVEEKQWWCWQMEEEATVEEETMGPFSPPRSETHGRSPASGLAPSTLPRSQPRAYDAAARSFRGPKAKTNFTLPGPPEPASDLILSKFDPVQASRPTSSGMSSTVESFSGPRVSNPLPSMVHRRPVNPVALEDCFDDDDDCVLTSSFRRKPLPFDLNLPPPEADDAATGGDLDRR